MNPIFLTLMILWLTTVVAFSWAFYSRRGLRVLVRGYLVVLIGGLAIGTATHLENLVRTGLHPRPDLPVWCNLFWSALTVIDAATIVLLLFRPRAGTVVVLFIMAADLSINLNFLGFSAVILSQCAYTLVALLGSPLVWTSRNRTQN